MPDWNFPKTSSPKTGSSEKSEEANNYAVDHPPPDYEDEGPVQCPSHTTERRLVARIDWHVVPCLCVMYLLAFLDRVNIANANVFGLSAELGLTTGNKYNTALVIFFVPYVLFEIPSNILLKKFKPHVWLSLNMFLFGFTTMMQGLVKSYGGLLATRFFLGLFETGMFPGAFYLIGMWYKRDEAQKRYSFFFSSTVLAGAFGGLLAAGIGEMDGIRGYAGWRWIFIIEGAITVAFAFAFFFLLPSFPEDSKWLKPDEKTYVSARLRVDQGNSAHERPITWRDVVSTLSDYKVIAAGFMYFGLIVPAYGYSYFAPGIIQSYGYSRIQTQLFSVPPWAACFGFSMLLAILSDRLRHRWAFAMFASCIGIAGFGILIAVHDNTRLQYGALFLVTSGVYSAMPLLVCWFNMNLGGHHRRAIGSAWQVGFGNIGGFIATFAFLAKDKPKYIPGFSICLAFVVLSMVASTVYGIGCVWENRRKERSARDVGLTEYEKMEMGDKNPDYRYML